MHSLEYRSRGLKAPMKLNMLQIKMLLNRSFLSVREISAVHQWIVAMLRSSKSLKMNRSRMKIGSAYAVKHR